MPTYKITAPDGRTLRLTGDSPPTEAELEEVFKSLPAASPGAPPESPKSSGGVMTDERGRALAIPNMPLGVALDTSTPEGRINNVLMAATGVGAGIKAAGGVVPFLVGAAKSAGGSYIGAKVGSEIGGAFGNSAAGREIGALAGGIAGPMVSPKALTQAAMGGRHALAEWLVGKTVTEADRKAATAIAEHAERRLALEAAKLAEKKAAREAMTAARARSASIAEERNALMKARLEGKAPLNRPTPKPVRPTPKPVPLGPTEAATPQAIPSGPTTAPTPTPVPLAPYDAEAQRNSLSTIVNQLQQRMDTVEGRRMVRKLLDEMPKDQASQIRMLLAKGQAKLPPTFYGKGGVQGGMSRPSSKWTDEALQASAELAKMLGQ